MSNGYPGRALMPVRSIVERAAVLFDVPARLIVSPRRDRWIIHARAAVCFAAFETGRSSPHIGRVLGRDHSTVLHAKNMARILAERHPKYAERLNELVGFAGGPLAVAYRLPEVAIVPKPAAKPRPPITWPIIPGVRMEIGESGEIEPVIVPKVERFDPLLAALRSAHPERFAA